MNGRQNFISKSSTLRTLVGVVAMSAALAGALNAATIISNDFSFGYTKANNTATAWTLQQPSTDVTQGDFKVNPLVASAHYSAGGPIFPNRVLTSAGANQWSGNSASFSASFTFSYEGLTPVDAAPIPNYQIRFVIDSISIYGVRYDTLPGDTLAFRETTAGHAATSPTVTLNNVLPPASNLQNATPYVQLVWNPVDYSLDGTSGLRSFDLDSLNGRPIDGFEIVGRVELTYSTVPEPSTIALGFIGLTAVLLFRRRKTMA